MTGDRWSGADDYESYVGRWSRQVARLFVSGLDVPTGSAWVDIGCGTGALSAAVLELGGPAGVTGVDPSADFVEAARHAIGDDRATFAVGSAAALPLPVASADALVSGLVLNWLPNVTEALGEMRRVGRPNAMIAAYVWDYADGMELIRRFFDAAIALDPAAIEEDEGVRFPICSPAGLRDAFEGAGLLDVTTWPIEIDTVFRDFADYWDPFETGVGAAPAYAMRLDVAHRTAIRERLRATLPIELDGSIRLTARAWAVRGRSPGI